MHIARFFAALMGAILALASLAAAEPAFVHEGTFLKGHNIERLFPFGEIVLCEIAEPHFSKREHFYNPTTESTWYSAAFRQKIELRRINNTRTFRPSTWMLVRNDAGETFAKLYGEIVKTMRHSTITADETRILCIDSAGKEQKVELDETFKELGDPLTNPNHIIIDTPYRIKFDVDVNLEPWRKPDDDDAPRMFSMWFSTGREEAVPLNRLTGKGVEFSSPTEQRSFTADNGLPSNRVSAVCLQRDRALIGFFDAPLERIDLKTNSIRHVSDRKSAGASLIAPFGFDWLVGTFTDGLYHLTSELELRPLHAEKCRINAVCLHADRLWIATSHGLAVYRISK